MSDKANRNAAKTVGRCLEVYIRRDTSGSVPLSRIVSRDVSVVIEDEVIVKGDGVAIP